MSDGHRASAAVNAPVIFQIFGGITVPGEDFNAFLQRFTWPLLQGQQLSGLAIPCAAFLG